MVLVQGIGMSGYVPLEGVAGLAHFKLNFLSGRLKYEFNYFYGVESFASDNLNDLNNVVSFAIVHRFDDRTRSSIVNEVGLLSGYYRAGVLFPRRLFYLFVDFMCLKGYHNWTYESDRFAYTTAWAEYVCVDFYNSDISGPCLFFQKLNRFKDVFPLFSCANLRNFWFSNFAERRCLEF
jgi:hypothetical protein